MKVQLLLVTFLSAILFSEPLWARRIKFPSEETLFEELIEIYDQEADLTSRIHLRVSYAQVLREHKKYLQAIKYASEAIKLAEAILNRSYYIEELLTRSYELRGRSYWELRQWEQSITDIYRAIEGYIQIEQYSHALALFKEYESIYTSWLQTQKNPRHLKAGLSFIQKVLPLLESYSQELNLQDISDFMSKRYFYIALGYRKTGDFHNAGRMFHKAGEISPANNPHRAVINFLAAGECFQKAKEFNYAYSAYLKVKAILLSLEGSEGLPEMLNKLRNNLPLLILMLDFLKKNFPKREGKFIRKLSTWISSFRK